MSSLFRRLGPLPLGVLALAAVACTEPSPEPLAPAPSFVKVKPPAYLTTLPLWTATETVAGVYGDGAAYPGEPSQSCGGGRQVRLVAPDGMPGTVAPPPVCPASGRSKLHFPDNPLSGDLDPYGASEPAYEIRGGRVRPTGWMSPTLNYYWDNCSGSTGCNFVWTDGVLDVTGATASITATCAKLYIGQNVVPVSPTSGPTCAARHGAGTVNGFPLQLDAELADQ
jgi:hypothetical protein